MPVCASVIVGIDGFTTTGAGGFGAATTGAGGGSEPQPETETAGSGDGREESAREGGGDASRVTLPSVSRQELREQTATGATPVDVLVHAAQHRLAGGSVEHRGEHLVVRGRFG